MYIRKVLQSYYCKIVFGASFLGSYFLMPSKVFHGILIPLVLLFMLAFALSLTCVVRNIKERTILSKKSTGSLLSVLFAGVGLAALQMCVVGAPVCGASVGLGILAVIMPGVMFDVFSDFAVEILILSILLQTIVLYKMNCFVRMGEKCS